MQAFMRTIFDLNHTGYWYPLIWALTAGVLLYRMPRKTEIIGGQAVQRWYWFTALLLVLPYILWAGYRTAFIDTGTYVQAFNNTTYALSDIPSYLAGDGKDKGFTVLVILCKNLGIREYHQFFMMVAAFQILCLTYTFRRYSENFWICIFLFVASTDYMSWMHNGMRQFIAVAMIFAAFRLQVERKYLRFALVVLLASTIHGSAMLMIPFAYIMSGPALNWKTLLMIIGIAVIIPSIDRFLPILERLLADTQYDDMMNNDIWKNDDGTNLIRVVVYSVPALIALVGHRQLRGNLDPVVNQCVNASLITMSVYLVSSVTSGIYIGRIPIYTTLHGYLALPKLIDQVFEEQSARLVNFLMIGCYAAFYFYQMQIVWGLLM